MESNKKNVMVHKKPCYALLVGIFRSTGPGFETGTSSLVGKNVCKISSVRYQNDQTKLQVLEITCITKNIRRQVAKISCYCN